MTVGRLWLPVAALIILGVGSLPTWAGDAAQTPQQQFRGTYFDAQDYAVHIASMRWGAAGEWKYTLRFTSEPHPPAFVKMFYVALGHVGRWTGLDVELVYHGARLLLGFLALLSIFRLANQVFAEPAHARMAFLMASVGSGLGWMQLIAGAPMAPISPTDFWLVDLYVHFSISVFPHFAFQLAVMAAALVLFLRYLETGAASKIAWICLLAIAAQAANPIALFTVDAAMAGAAVFHWWRNGAVQWRHLRGLAVIGAAQVPLLAYNAAVLLRSPVWSEFSAQNVTLAPPASFLLWGLAPFLPLAVVGAARAVRTRQSHDGALLAWAGATLALAYLPVLFQRRFLLGATIPLGLLACLGLQEIEQWASRDRRPQLRSIRSFGLAYVLVAAVSSFYLSLGSVQFMRTRPPEYFYPTEVAAALEWLARNATRNELVLSSPHTGQLVAQFTDLRPFVGHEMETIHFREKLALLESYYRGEAEPGWARETATDWIFYGPYERQISAVFQPEADLEAVYSNEGVVIYAKHNP